MNHPELHQKAFLWLLIAVSIAFAWILMPFYGAVFWAAILGIMFAPFFRRLLLLMRMRRNLAALTTLLLSLVVVIIPLTLIVISLVNEAGLLYQQIKSGEINFTTYFQQMIKALPAWAVALLDRFGLADITGVLEKITAGFGEAGQVVASRVLNIGQNAFNFFVNFAVMMYMLFFLLRDGDYLVIRVKQAIPLSNQHKQLLFTKFTTVIRATVKGNLVVAAIQGALGGLIFWFLGIHGAILWGVLMAFLSLLPAIGAALIWAPVAIYFLLTGDLAKGFILIAFGALVIGVVDNVLRPILVGKDTRMPDYVVLISTVGGMALFGLNGFVIGPVIAALFIAAWDMFSTERDANVE